MYAVAGRITEHVTNQSWQENLSKYIFNPLDMSATYGNVVPASKDHNFALGYGVLDTIPTLVLQESFALRDAGGNIYSSVEDMSKWLKVLLNRGRYQEKQFLAKGFLDKAMGKQQLMHRDTITNESRYYGYGWMNSYQDGHLKIEHSGGISGYTSNIVLFPEDDLALVVLTNQNSAGIAYAITDQITSRLLDVEVDPSSNVPYFSRIYPIEDPSTDTVINEDSPPTHVLGDFSGDFYCEGFGTITVSFKEHTLYVEFPFTTFRLEHQANNEFNDHFTVRKSQVMSNFLSFNFQSNKAGVIDRVLLNINNEPVAFVKK
jgi:hypothetical protein